MNDSPRKRSIRHEDRIAKATGGRRQKGSGSYGFRPGDVQYDACLMEHKFTAAGSYSLAASLLRKINDEAFRLNKFPAFAVTFENMPFDTPKDWVMVPLSEFQRLL